jgi:hypothetical protein
MLCDLVKSPGRHDSGAFKLTLAFISACAATDRRAEGH